MAFSFESIGWEDESGDRWQGSPDESEIDNVYGLFVHAYDPVTGEHDYFWAFVPSTWDTWDEWWEYIGALMASHGMELA